MTRSRTAESGLPANVSLNAAVGMAVAGVVAGIIGPKVVDKVKQRLKPGGAFSNVRNSPRAGADVPMFRRILRRAVSAWLQTVSVSLAT